MVRADPIVKNDLEDSFLEFLRREGQDISRGEALLREPMLRLVTWREEYGRQVPNLQRIALRVLSQDCSSCVSEWSWTTFNLVQTKKTITSYPSLKCKSWCSFK